MPFGHEFGPMKLLSSFSAKTHPMHYLRSNTHILGGFAPFGCSKCNVAKSGPMMLFGHEFGPMKLFLSFPAKTHPIHYFRYKTHVLGCFAPFGCCKCTIVKSGPRMPFWHEFRATNFFSRFSTKTHPIHYIRSKTHILGGFAPFVCSKCTVAKSVPRLPFWHESRPTKLFLGFSAKTHPIHYVQSKTHVLCVFAPSGCRKCTFAKSVPWMPFWHEFGPTKLLSSFSDKTRPIH